MGLKYTIPNEDGNTDIDMDEEDGWTEGWWEQTQSYDYGVILQKEEDKVNEAIENDDHTKGTEIDDNTGKEQVVQEADQVGNIIYVIIFIGWC